MMTLAMSQQAHLYTLLHPSCTPQTVAAMQVLCITHTVSSELLMKEKKLPAPSHPSESCYMLSQQTLDITKCTALFVIKLAML
jgi:hypothetical protein